MQRREEAVRGSRTWDPPPSGPPMGPPPYSPPPEVRAAEIIAAALLEVAKSVDRLTEAVKDSGDDAAHS